MFTIYKYHGMKITDNNEKIKGRNHSAIKAWARVVSDFFLGRWDLVSLPKSKNSMNFELDIAVVLFGVLLPCKHIQKLFVNT